MKRILPVAIIIILFISISSGAHAYNMKTYTVDEIGISIQFPSDCTVLTRNTNDAAYAYFESKYGISKQDMLNSLVSTNTYLDAYDEGNSVEYMLRKANGGGIDYAELSDEELKSFVQNEDSVSSMAALGATVTKADTYSNAQAKYLKVYFERQETNYTAYCLEYVTEAHGKAFLVVVNCAGTRISQDVESKMKAIVDSIDFGNTAPSAAPTAAFKFKDDSVNIEFTVPENWRQEALSKDYDFISAKFVNNQEPTAVIVYGGVDGWGQLTSAEKAGTKRTDFNNSSFSISDIAEMCNANMKDVAKVTLGGNEYYRIKTTNTRSIEGISISFDTLIFCRIENGFIYQFQFLGDETSPYYKDFESLVSSAVYKGSTTSAPVMTPGPSGETHNKNGNPSLNGTTNSTNRSNEIGIIVLSIVLSIAIYSIPILVYRYAIAKAVLPTKKAILMTVISAVVVIAITQIIISIINQGNRIASCCSVVVWSAVIYLILARGKAKEKVSPATETIIIPREPETTFSLQREKDDPSPIGKPSFQPSAPSIYYRAHTPESVQNTPIRSERTTSQFTPGAEVQSSARKGSITCPQCGKLILEDSVFCCFCGATIERTVPKVHYCRKCGNKLLEGSAFCNRCGAKVES